MSYFVKQLKRQTVGRNINVRMVLDGPGYDHVKRTLHFYDFAWQPSGCSPSDKEEARRDRIRDRVTKIQAEEFDEHGDLYYCELDLSSAEAKTAILERSHIKVFRCERRRNSTGIGLIDSDTSNVGTFEGYAVKSQGAWYVVPPTAKQYLEHYGVESYVDLVLGRFGSGVQVRFKERFPKRVPEPEGVYPSFESKEQAIAWIASQSKRIGKRLWVSKSIRLCQSAEWIVEEKCPLLVECYDDQGIRHG